MPKPSQEQIDCVILEAEGAWSIQAHLTEFPPSCEDTRLMLAIMVLEARKQRDIFSESLRDWYDVFFAGEGE